MWWDFGFFQGTVVQTEPGQCSRCSDSLRAGRPGNRKPVVARFSAPVQTGLGALPVSCTMGTGCLTMGVKRPGRGINQPPPSSAAVKERIELTLLPLWAFMACSRVNYTFVVVKMFGHNYTSNSKLFFYFPNVHMWHILLLFISTYVQGICSYIPEMIHVSRVQSVASIL